jgi:xanthine/CO dehydrogenase XdhC/CoxF family maturation factor
LWKDVLLSFHKHHAKRHNEEHEMEDYQGRTVTIQSGEETLTGTVTRTSKTSLWATFGGKEYRFSRSQDGNLRRHGTTGNRFAPILVFVPEAPSIQEILAAADTTSNNWVGEVLHGSQRAILTFGTRKAATATARQLKDAGAEVQVADRNAYGEYLLTAKWSA